MNFNGSTTYVTMNDAAELEWGATDGSVSAWFKTDADLTDIYGDIVLVGRGGTGNNTYRINIDPNYASADDQVIFVLTDDLTVERLRASGVNDGDWHHVVGVRSGNTAYMYLDGVEVDSADITGMGSVDQASNPFYTIGGNEDATPFNGALDDVRIYNRALSAAEVKRLYELGATTKIATTIKTPTSPLEQGLVGHWTFDGPDVDWASTTAEIKDRSGQGNHGDAQGGVNTRSVTPGPLGQGMEFDGVDDY
jgi:Laminin G domain.